MYIEIFPLDVDDITTIDGIFNADDYTITTTATTFNNIISKINLYTSFSVLIDVYNEDGGENYELFNKIYHLLNTNIITQDNLYEILQPYIHSYSYDVESIKFYSQLLLQTFTKGDINA